MRPHRAVAIMGVSFLELSAMSYQRSAKKHIAKIYLNL
jgi:hypothetical protein